MQTDYVATSIEPMQEVDEFRVVTASAYDWSDLLFLAERTEMQNFVRQVDGVRRIFLSVHQTRHRSTFYDLDWSILDPVIRWTPRRNSPDQTGEMDNPMEHDAHPDSIGQDQPEFVTPPNLTQQIGNQSMIDLNTNPIIDHAGFRFSEIEINASSRRMTGVAENIGNTDAAQTVVFEFLDVNWDPLGTATFGPVQHLGIGDFDFFSLNVSQATSRARFIRVVS